MNCYPDSLVGYMICLCCDALQVGLLAADLLCIANVACRLMCDVLIALDCRRMMLDGDCSLWTSGKHC